IRTLGARKGTTVFETAPIDHSGIFPLKFMCIPDCDGVRWRVLRLQSYYFFSIITRFFLIFEKMMVTQNWQNRQNARDAVGGIPRAGFEKCVRFSIV
ncbi:MAG: hypothetical protein K2L30_10240, partial [Duncaniella sp.]|nr:hypothetical protein [Duncaniella sp.]